MKETGDNAVRSELPDENPAGAGRLLILLLIATMVFGLLHFTPLGDRLGELLDLRQTLTGAGRQNLAIFTGLCTLLITFGAPRLFFFTLGGFLFGFVDGLLGAMAATMVASFISFNAIRWGGRQWVRERFGKRRFAGWITRMEPTALSVFLVRQLPISNMIINMSLALSTVGNRAFLIGSFFGFLPQGIAAVLIGSGLADEGTWMGFLQLAGAGLVLLLYTAWFWLSRKRKALEIAEKFEEEAHLAEGG